MNWTLFSSIDTDIKAVLPADKDEESHSVSPLSNLLDNKPQLSLFQVLYSTESPIYHHLFSMAKLGIWIAFGRRRGRDPLHWMILVAPQDNSGVATWYHVTGGPSQGTEYKVVIQNPKRFDSHGISEHHYVGELDEKDQKKLKASAQKIPAQRCQEWTVGVLGDLERKGLVAEGTAEHWFNQVEPSPYSTDGYHGIQAASSSAAGTSRTPVSRAPVSRAPVSQASSEWVWDGARGEYRKWNAMAGRWVWASEVVAQ